MGAGRPRVDHVRRPARHADGRVGARREAARRRARDPREPRADRAHQDGRRPVRGQRLLRARARPAVRGGRHRRVPGRGRGGGRARADPARALRRRHEGRRDASSSAASAAARLAAIGFCFGGGMVWRLLASREPRLAAAAPFYGPFPEGGSLKGSRAAVLGVYGGLDARVNASQPGGQGGARGGAAQARARSRSPRPTTRSSTTPARASTRTRRRRRGGGR